MELSFNKLAPPKSYKKSEVNTRFYFWVTARVVAFEDILSPLPVPFCQVGDITAVTNFQAF